MFMLDINLAVHEAVHVVKQCIHQDKLDKDSRESEKLSFLLSCKQTDKG